MEELIDKLSSGKMLSQEEFTALYEGRTPELLEYLKKRSGEVARKTFGRSVYIRGLIEFTSFCRNNCLYCGLRAGNPLAERYRLSCEDILACCKAGYEVGFRTFVLQGGEDPAIGAEEIASIVSSIKEEFPECAVTLSVGERSREDYELFFRAGADRYLLRHETADEEHYGKLHPPQMSLKERKQCLRTLKDIGYQTGAGFMVGSPYQGADTLYEDFCFLKELQPEMVGIGPFIPHKDTPFADMAQGTLFDTLFCLGLVRLLLPKALIPATTALGTIHPTGRVLGMEMGANVVMPNLSPEEVRGKYSLYNGKISSGAESGSGLDMLRAELAEAGFEVVCGRGDFPGWEKKQI